MQQFLVIGGILILSYLSLTFFKSNSTQTDSNYNNEVIIMGTGIGQSMLEEILTKSFDENTITSSVNNADSLTSVSSLGKDAGENSSLKYDDVDDYKNFTRSDTLENLGVFTTTVLCCYVNEVNTDLTSYSRTFLKRIDVSVTGENLKIPLKFNYIVSY